MSTGTELYNKDIVLWAEEQAAALRDAARSGINLPIDWENVAEEIEGVGASQRHELRSRIAVIMEHLLKLEYSPSRPRRSWMDTIDRERSEVEAVLSDSPSLRREIVGLIEWNAARTARSATRRLFGYGETVKPLPVPSYSEEQVLGDWFPEPPRSLSSI